MSFSKETKNELARMKPEKKCCMLAEIAAFIKTAGSISLAGGGKFVIRLNTKNHIIAKHFRSLLKSYFDIDATISMGEENSLKKGRYYTINIGPEQLSEQILRESGILMIREGMNYITDGIYDGLIKTKCCRRTYLRGEFLGAGTMTDPKKAYDFEIILNSEVMAEETKRLITSFKGLSAKIARRKKDYVVYVREAGHVLDILAIMGAHSQYFAYQNVRLMKEMRNEANRKANCDQANIDKAIKASERHIEAIRKLELSDLPEKLRQVADARLKHPEASLSELGELLNPPLKKSGVNKRLLKIMQLAEMKKEN